MHKSFLLIVLFVALAFAQTKNKFSSYGAVLNGYPSWEERATLVLANIARMNPTGYKATYNAPSTVSGLVPVTPYFEHYDLARAARAHSIDMDTNCGLQHNSCDGTGTFVRIGRYYTESGTLAENVAQTAFSGVPEDAIRDWMNSAGHKANIMSSSYRVYGNGNSRKYWTQNFGGGTNSANNAIAAGVHLLKNSTHLQFALNYYQRDVNAPAFVSVLINGVRHNMRLNSNYAFVTGTTTTANGTYTVDLPRIASGCRNYAFQVQDSTGATFLYPDSGALVTFKENTGCTTFYNTTSPVIPPAPVTSKQNSVAVTAMPSLVLLFLLIAMFLLFKL